MNKEIELKNKESLKVISLFSGIGAFEKALTRRNIPHEVVNYCEIDKYAATAYSAIHNVPEEKNLGDISKVNFKDLPDVDLVTYGFPCFVAGTLVLTNKGYKKIEEVEEGEEVLTHNNNFKSVKRIMNKTSDHYYILRNELSEDIKVTSEHPFYVREKINDTYTKPEWVKVKDLKPTHMLGVVVNKKEVIPDLNNYSLSFNEIEKISEFIDKKSFWWLIGRWLKSSLFDNNDFEGFSIKDNPVLEDLIETKIHDLKLPYKKIKKKDKITFVIKDKVFVKLLKAFKLNRQQLLIDIINLPSNLLKYLLISFTIFDSSISRNGETILKFKNSSFAYAFGQVVAKAYQIPYRISKVEDSYYVSFFNEDTYSNKTFYENGYIWTPLNDLYKLNDTVEVFNLEVEDDNSYTVNNIIVHNCQDISNAGLKRGIIKDKTRSGLLYYALDLIEEKKPKYAICENVKNLVGKKFKKDFEDLLNRLDELGYNNYWKVVNSKDQGIPQNRERVFVVSIRKDLEQEYKFPENILLESKLEDILEKDINETFYLSQAGVERLIRHKNKIICNDTPMVSGCIHAGYYKMGGRDQQYIKLKKTYEFPMDKQLTLKLKDLLEDEVDEIYYVEQDRINNLLKELKDKNCIAVREGTIKGFSEAEEGDSINTDYPNSIVRRGRVGKGISNTLLTATKICVVEKIKNPEKKLETILEKRLLEYAEKNKDIPDFFNAYNKRIFNELAPTITTTIGSTTSISGVVKCEGVERNSKNIVNNGEVITYKVPKTVRVRVYDVDKEKLHKLLTLQKDKLGYSCREISRQGNVPQTLVEHWFRGDDSFSIPHPEIWTKLKSILKIDDNLIKEGVISKEELEEFDKQITTFEIKEGNYDKGNRIYDVEGNIPTLTTICKEHTIVDLETFRIRKLTPLETWRLMGFDDEDYFKAKEALIEKHYKGKDKTNSQMYHMAGNSIVVNVLEGIFDQLFNK